MGSVRRGYFIEGLGGAQFALPGAIERLRAVSATPMIALAATDPANPYGAILPWPPTEGTPQRRAGSTLSMMDGLPIVWLDPGGKRVVTFEADAELTVEALWELVSRRSRSAVSSIDGTPAHDHPLGPFLEKRGFVPGYKGFTIPRHATNRP